MFQSMIKTADASVRHMQELQQVQARLLERLAPASKLAPAAVLPALAPLHRLHQYQALFGHAGTRHLHGIHGLWQFALKLGQDDSIVAELLAMQRAIIDNLATQQVEWVGDMKSLAEEVASLKKVNTMSKLMEQEYNVCALYGALLVGQATKLINLFENAQIGYGYLFAQQVPANAQD